ncbi:tyrosine-type recombinase/integrase [Geminocystis sp. NIES-3708]|uniref:tyrosine-type recombinase/integrase n=1 Tax=Geminocystis sp. NIES-3708 TaxID=1615909 RepID=UPI00082AB35E|nr:tyrosine-type recombinase/integrase [Geminocystis sp. NIES-3708]
MTQLTFFPKHRLIPLPTLDVNNIVNSMLMTLNSETTRKTYRYAFGYFCHYITTGKIKRGAVIKLDDSEVIEIIEQFFSLSEVSALSYAEKYQSILLKNGLSPSTINARVASIKSLVRYAFNHGSCNFLLDKIKTLPAKNYRDTKGVKPDTFAQVIENIDTSTLKGKRDYAILRLLWDNALRRGELCNLNITDFNAEEGTLRITGKGQLESEIIYLTKKTVIAILVWLDARTAFREDSPLFIALDNHTHGQRLTGKSIYTIVRGYGDLVNLSKILSPHRIRHSSITAILDATGGNVRVAQQLSRHHDINILTVYDDNRKTLQKSASEILASLL